MDTSKEVHKCESVKFGSSKLIQLVRAMKEACPHMSRGTFYQTVSQLYYSLSIVSQQYYLITLSGRCYTKVPYTNEIVQLKCDVITWTGPRKYLVMLHANRKVKDQPA